MKFAVIGAGGVGGPFGAALAKAGHDVTFIARGAHLTAIRERGLRIDGARTVHLHPAQATDDPSTAGPVDAVLFTVKTWAIEEAGASLGPLLGSGTAVLALQNGVDAADRLAAVIGPDSVMRGIAEISASIKEPGVIHQVSDYMRLRFGEVDGGKSARGAALHDAFRDAGIETEFTQTIEKVMWRKFIMLAAVSGLTGLTRATFGEVRSDPDTRALLTAAIEEAMAVGLARGVDLDPDSVAQTLSVIDGLPAGGRASMALDLERGNRLELPWLSGAVVRIGRDLDVPTPVHGFICAALKLHQDGRTV